LRKKSALEIALSGRGEPSGSGLQRVLLASRAFLVDLSSSSLGSCGIFPRVSFITCEGESFQVVFEKRGAASRERNSVEPTRGTKGGDHTSGKPSISEGSSKRYSLWQKIGKKSSRFSVYTKKKAALLFRLQRNYLSRHASLDRPGENPVKKGSFSKEEILKDSFQTAISKNSF